MLARVPHRGQVEDNPEQQMSPQPMSLPIVPLSSPGEPARAGGGCGGGGGGGGRRNGGGCGCGERAATPATESDHAEHDGEEMVLDVRAVPLGIRASTALGVFSSVPVDSSIVVITSGDPTPLLTKLRTDALGALDVEPLDETPGAWTVRVTRRLPQSA